MKGRRSPYYGQLMTETLPSEVKKIWYSRDDELEPLPSWRWSWQHQTDLEQIEQRELLVKILEATILSDKEAKAIEMVAIGNSTFADLADELDVTDSRAQQIYNNGIRKLRKMQAGFTGIPVWDVLSEIYTWRAFRSIRRSKKGRA